MLIELGRTRGGEQIKISAKEQGVSGYEMLLKNAEYMAQKSKTRINHSKID